MTIELVNTGSELLLGRVLNTHQQWLCRSLADHGYLVSRQVAVPDTAIEIQSAVREALTRADLVITTGGLGPTCDDLTRELVAELLGRKLTFDLVVEERIREYFVSRGRPVPPGTRVEAMVPDGAVVLLNQWGTAPGLAIPFTTNPFRSEGKPGAVLLLPGPPRELHPMWRNQALPWIRRQYPPDVHFVCRTRKTTGLGESNMEERLLKPLSPLIDRGLQLGFCARVGEVDVRFVATGIEGDGLVAEAEKILEREVGEHVFGEQDELLEQVVVRELAIRKLTLGLAESCTGGYLAHRITNVPGASEVLRSGWITYSNESKTSQLGVPETILTSFGAVSEPVAAAMAEGARKRSGATLGLAVTGIAGPGGGSTEKPVGTVFIAIATPDSTQVIRSLNAFDRETFKYLTAQQGFDWIRRTASKFPKPASIS